MSPRIRIGGALDSLAHRRLHFSTLTQPEQFQAVRRLAATGMSDYGISHATGLAVEQTRRVLAQEACE